MRLLTPSAFVDEDERAAFVVGFFLWRARSCACRRGSALRCARAPFRPGVAGSTRVPAGSSRRGLRGMRPRTRRRSGEPPAGRSTRASGSGELRGLRATATSGVGAARRRAAACVRRSPAAPCPRYCRRHSLTVGRATLSRRAVSDCLCPWSSSRIASKRRFSIAWKSRFTPLGLPLPI